MYIVHKISINQSINQVVSPSVSQSVRANLAYSDRRASESEATQNLEGAESIHGLKKRDSLVK